MFIVIDKSLQTFVRSFLSQFQLQGIQQTEKTEVRLTALQQRVVVGPQREERGRGEWVGLKQRTGNRISMQLAHLLC